MFNRKIGRTAFEVAFRHYGKKFASAEGSSGDSGEVLAEAADDDRFFTADDIRGYKYDENIDISTMLNSYVPGRDSVNEMEGFRSRTAPPPPPEGTPELKPGVRIMKFFKERPKLPTIEPKEPLLVLLMRNAKKGQKKAKEESAPAQTPRNTQPLKPKRAAVKAVPPRANLRKIYPRIPVPQPKRK